MDILDSKVRLDFTLNKDEHYFISNFVGWSTDTNFMEAVRKATIYVPNTFTDDAPITLYVCKVYAPASAKYTIEAYLPKYFLTEEGKRTAKEVKFDLVMLDYVPPKTGKKV